MQSRKKFPLKDIQLIRTRKPENDRVSIGIRRKETVFAQPGRGVPDRREGFPALSMSVGKSTRFDD